MGPAIKCDICHCEITFPFEPVLDTTGDYGIVHSRRSMCIVNLRAQIDGEMDVK